MRHTRSSVRVGLLATLAVLLLAGCASPNPAAPAPSAAPPVASAPPSRLLDPAAFAAAVGTPGTTTVNVHVPYAGDVPGTDLSIPFDRIGTETARLPADHAAPLALYCRTGPMSAIAARTLADQGYTDIVELAGGMTAWTASGRPLVDDPGPH